MRVRREDNLERLGAELEYLTADGNSSLEKQKEQRCTKQGVRWTN